MALRSLYTKYGNAAAPDMDALVAGQQAAGDSLKDALGGVDKLMQDTEERYREKNTLNMQEYLKGSIKNAGLGADPVDTIGIKKKFGDLINMDQVDETIAGTREEMTTEAVDNASGVAGNVFSKTENMADATNAFRQTLQKANMPEQDINKTVRGWREDNQYLAEDVKLNKKRMMDGAVSGAYQKLRQSDGQLSFEDVANEAMEGVDPKFQPELMGRLREEHEDWTKLSTEQQEELAAATAQADTYVNAGTQQIDAQVQQIGDSYKAMPGVGDGAYALVDELSGQLGGPIEAISKDAENGWVTAATRGILDIMPWNWDNQTGSEIGSVIQTGISDLVNGGMDPKDATAVGVQAYQDLKTKASEGSLGTVIPAKELKATMANYATMQEKKLQGKATYTKAQEQALKKKAALINQATATKAEWKKGERFSNISGKSYDTTENFRNTIYGGSQLPDTKIAGASEYGSNKKTDSGAGKTGDVWAEAKKLAAEKNPESDNPSLEQSDNIYDRGKEMGEWVDTKDTKDTPPKDSKKFVDTFMSNLPEDPDAVVDSVKQLQEFGISNKQNIYLMKELRKRQNKRDAELKEQQRMLSKMNSVL